MGQKDAARTAFEKATRALRLGASPGDTPDEMISPSLGLAFLAWADGSSHSEVTKHLDTARLEAPRSSYVEMFAGMHAASEENYTKAESALTKAMRYAPNYAELDGWLGKVYLGLARAAVESGADPKDSAQEFERAIRFTERAADREEKSIKGAFAMRVREAMVRAAAEHLPRRTRYSAALATVQKVLSRDKNREQPAALALRGYCNFQLEEYPQCMRDLQQVLDVVPADAEGNPWQAYREYAAARLEDVKRWRSLERKNVVFEGVTLTKDWQVDQSSGPKVRVDEGVFEAVGESTKDGSLIKPTFSAMNQTLFDKGTFVEVSMTATIPSEVNGQFLNNNISGIRVAQASRSGGRGSRKSSSIGIFSDKGRIAVQVGNGRKEELKDGLVHRLLDDNGKEISWPSNGPVRVRIVREDDEKGVLAIYLNDEFVFRETISGFKKSRGPLGLWIMGYGNQAQPFNVRVNDIEVIRRKAGQ
jgi:tetratricopeptide (TPR) repeat protein